MINESLKLKPPAHPLDAEENRDLIIEEIRSVRGLLELVLRTLTLNNKREIKMAKTQAEYLNELTALQANLVDKVTAQSTLVGGIETAVKGMVAVIAALKQQIADLLAQGGDPSLLQPLLDSATAALTGLEQNSARISAAALEGTPQNVA